MVILAMGITTGLSLYGSYARGSVIEMERSAAHQLCAELMAEILTKHFESSAYGPGSFGRAAGETARADFDDVDDYDDWTESPPQTPDGSPLAGNAYADYTRSVTVWNVDEADMRTPQSDGSTGAKVIEIIVSRNGKERARLLGHRTRYSADD